MTSGITFAHRNKHKQKIILSIKQFFLLAIFLSLVFVLKAQDENLTYSNALARACVEKADKFVEKENFAAALRWMNKAIKRNPNQAELYYNRGVIYRLTGNYDLALSDFNQTIKLRPDIGRAWLNKGMSHHELKQYEEAIDSYKEAAIRLRDVADTHALRADALSRLGRHDESATAYQQALAVEKNNNAWRLLRAEALRKTGAFSASRAEADRVLRTDSTLGEAWIIRGKAQLEQGLPYEALLDSKAAERAGADESQVRMLKGDIHLALGQVSTAANLYEGVIEENPHDAEGFFRRGKMYLVQADYRQAQRDLLQAVRLDSGVASYRIGLGEAFEGQGEYQLAMRQYDKAWELDSKSRRLMRARGLLRARTADFDGALADLDQLVNARPNDTSALRLRSTVRQQAGLLKASLADIIKVMETDSSKASDWAWLGYVQTLLRDFNDAENSLKKARNADPSLGAAYTYLGAHAILSDHILSAQEHLDRAIILSPQKPDAYFWKAVLLNMEGKSDEACLDWNKARERGMTEAHMPQPLSLDCE